MFNSGFSFFRFSSTSPSGIHFDDSSFRAIKAAERRKWTTIGTVVALVCLGVFITVYSQNAKESEKKIVSEYLKADAIYQAETESFLTKAQAQPSSMKPTDRPDHLQSAKQFEQFIKIYPNNSLSLVAGLRAATEYLEIKELDKARNLLESMLPNTQKSMLFQVRVRRALASVYTEQGDYKKALAEIDYLVKYPDNPILSETKLFAAKVHYLSGDKDNAAKLLHELAANNEVTVSGESSSISQEASLWLVYWDLK